MNDTKIIEDFLRFILKKTNNPYGIQFRQKGIMVINFKQYFVYAFNDSRTFLDIPFRFDNGVLYMFNTFGEVKERNFKEWFKDYKKENDEVTPNKQE